MRVRYWSSTKIDVFRISYKACRCRRYHLQRSRCIQCIGNSGLPRSHSWRRCNPYGPNKRLRILLCWLQFHNRSMSNAHCKLYHLASSRTLRNPQLKFLMIKIQNTMWNLTLVASWMISFIIYFSELPHAQKSGTDWIRYFLKIYFVKCH